MNAPLGLDAGFDLDTGELGMLGAGGFIGGALAGVTMYVFGIGSLLLLSALFGMGTAGGGWIVMLLGGVVLAVPFGLFVSGSINAFVNRVIMLSSRNEALQRALVPLLERSALTVTTSALGSAYGLAVGVVLYLLVIPIWVSTVGVPIPTPSLVVAGVVGVVAFVLYGSVLGFVYGMLTES